MTPRDVLRSGSINKAGLSVPVMVVIGSDLRFRRYGTPVSGRMRVVALRLLYLILLRVFGWIALLARPKRRKMRRFWCSVISSWSSGGGSAQTVLGRPGDHLCTGPPPPPNQLPPSRLS